jgi:3D (Asp-Asp-Asp) domain-containing protein
MALKKALLVAMIVPAMLQSTELGAPTMTPPDGEDASLPIADSGTQADVDFVAFGFPTPQLSGRTKLDVWATYYSVPRVHALAQAGNALFDKEGRDLGVHISDADWCAAAMNGTVEVTTRHGLKRIFSFDGEGDEAQVDCEPYYPGYPAIGRSRFHVAHARYGEGAHGVHVVPYRTIAVDPRFLAQGTVLYVPQARGTVVTLPSGETHIHDGYFYAADTGGAIEGNHIDVFLGFSVYNPFIFVKSRSDAEVEAYVVEDPWVEEMMASAHWTPTGRGPG